MKSTKKYLQDIKELHNQYKQAFHRKILQDLKKLSLNAFEHFARKFLEVYGFEDVKVTQVGKDGGIDGSGKLKVGLAHLEIAFQCKKRNSNTIGRPETDKFRGIYAHLIIDVISTN